jgi:hypothetical protein
MTFPNVLDALPKLAKQTVLQPEERNVLRQPAGPLGGVREGVLVQPKPGPAPDLPLLTPERVSVFLGPGATFTGVADTLIPIFTAAGGAAPIVGRLAQALVAYVQNYLPVPSSIDCRVGLRLPLPIEVSVTDGAWIVSSRTIESLAGEFLPAWQVLLRTPPVPLDVPDPLTLEAAAGTVVAAARPVADLARELWGSALRNPFDAVLWCYAVLRAQERKAAGSAATLALAILGNATAAKARLLAATSAGNAILRRCDLLLRVAPAGADAAAYAAARRLLDGSIWVGSGPGRTLALFSELPDTATGMAMRPGVTTPIEGSADDPPGGLHRLVLGRDLAVGPLASRPAGGHAYVGPEFAGRLPVGPYLIADAAALEPPGDARTEALLTVLGGARGIERFDAVSARGPGLLSAGLDRWSASDADALPTLLLAFKKAAPDEFDLFFALHGLDVDPAPAPAHPARGRLLRIGLDGIPAAMDPAALQTFLGGQVQAGGSVRLAPEWAARTRLPALVSAAYRRVQVAQTVARLNRVTPKPAVDSRSADLAVPLTAEGLAGLGGGGTTFRITSTTKAIATIEAYEGFNSGTGRWERPGKALLAHSKLVPNPAAASEFLVPTPMRVVYPEDPARPGQVAGSDALPVVLIIHGNHAAFDPIYLPPTTTITKINSAGVPVALPLAELASSVTDVPNHAGYGRLQDLLATAGIVSMSVSTNAANFFGSLIDMRTTTAIAALEQLKKLSLDRASRYFGRLNLTKLGVMGHSRGGDVAVAVAKRLAGHPDFKVLAACSLSPTDFTGTATDATQLRLNRNDLKFYLAVYGTLDGDVSGLGGADDPVGTAFRHYDRAACPKAMVQISRCCHNRFNSVWSDGTPAVPADPLKKFQGDDSGIVATDLPLLRSFDLHQKMEGEYVGGLFRWQLLGDTTVHGLFDGSRTNRVRVPATLQWSFGARVLELDDLENATTPSLPGVTRTLSVGGRIGFPSVTAPEATLKAGGSATLVPIGEHVTHASQILRVDATGPTPSSVAMTLTFPSPGTAGDGPGNWRDFTFLALRLSYTLDITTDAALAASPKPTSALKLTDNAGRSRRVANATQFSIGVPSRPDFHLVKTGAASTGNATLFRFETVRVPLVQFSRAGGVDLARVKELAVEFDPGVKTRVLFDSFQLVKQGR